MHLIKSVPCRLRIYIVFSLKIIMFLLLDKSMGPQLGPHDSFCQIYRGREVVRFRVTVSYWLLFIVASVASLHILFSEPAYLDSAWR